MPADDNLVNLNEIRRLIEDAEDFSSGKKPPKARDDGLPDDCPVQALGHHAGVYYYLDAMLQTRAFPADKHGRLQIMSLFGTKTSWLYEHWPRLGKATGPSGEPIVTGWRPEAAAEALMQAAARVGIWSPLERSRGAGGWRGDDNELIMHCGDAVLEITQDGRRRWFEPGLSGRYVYPAAAALPRPLESYVSASPIWELLKLLQSWNWRDPELDPVLLLGWIAAGLLGGALRWRPVVWITGSAGMGKSAIKNVVLEPIADGALVVSSDTSAAGLWQRLGTATLPVAVDELEASSDNRRVDDVVKLARVAASGDLILRGGQDHTGVQFQARSAFYFSSINMPPLLPQDVSRIAVLQLRELGDRPPLQVQPRKLREIGIMLRTRLVQAWSRAEPVMDWYRAEGMTGQHRMSARAVDLYGTLLGLAEIALWDERDDAGNQPAAWLAIARERSMATEELVQDERMFLAHLLSLVVQPSPGDRRTIAEMIHGAAGWVEDTTAAVRQRQLGTYGLRVEWRDGVPWLLVARQHQGLAQALSGTHWGGRSGAVGVWVQPCSRLALTLDGEEQTGTKHFAGVPSRAVALPLYKVAPPPNGAEQMSFGSGSGE